MPSMARKWYNDGRDEGRQEGRQEAVAAVMMPQLRRRIGILGAELEKRVLALPLARVTELGEALLDFNTHDDLTNWLNQNASQT